MSAPAIGVPISATCDEPNQHAERPGATLARNPSPPRVRAIASQRRVIATTPASWPAGPRTAAARSACMAIAMLPTMVINPMAMAMDPCSSDQASRPR